MRKILCVLLTVLYLNVLPVMAITQVTSKTPDYLQLVNLEEKEVIFTTKLSKKYIGKVFTLTNNYQKPIIIKSIELTNDRGLVPVFKNSRYKMTPGSMALSFVGGLLAIPTFGISTVLLIPAISEVTIKNNKIKKEARSNISEIPQNEVTLEVGKSYEVKAIFDKTQALNRMPKVQFNCFDPENSQEFTITNIVEEETIEDEK